MEHQNIMDLLGNTSGQPVKLRAKVQGEINDNPHETYYYIELNYQSILKTTLCDYSDVYILFIGTISVANTASPDPNINSEKKINVIFKNCAPFTDCISEINYT